MCLLLDHLVHVVLALLHHMVELGLPDLGHAVVHARIDHRIPRELVEVVVEVGEEDEQHLDELVDREFVLFLCLVLEGIEIDLAHAPVHRVFRVGEGPGTSPFYGPLP